MKLILNQSFDKISSDRYGTHTWLHYLFSFDNFFINRPNVLGALSLVHGLRCVSTAGESGIDAAHSPYLAQFFQLRSCDFL